VLYEAIILGNTRKNIPVLDSS